MLKITDRTALSRKFFALLDPGDLFKFSSSIFMKIRSISTSPQTPGYNALDLETYECVHVSLDMDVTLLNNTELIIKGGNQDV